MPLGINSSTLLATHPFPWSINMQEKVSRQYWRDPSYPYVLEPWKVECSSQVSTSLFLGLPTLFQHERCFQPKGLHFHHTVLVQWALKDRGIILYMLTEYNFIFRFFRSFIAFEVTVLLLMSLLKLSEPVVKANASWTHHSHPKGYLKDWKNGYVSAWDLIRAIFVMCDPEHNYSALFCFEHCCVLSVE